MFRLLWEEFWEKRDLIREHIEVHPSSPADATLPETDPYSLREPFPRGLRTLDLSHFPIFELVHDANKILIRDEYINVYNHLRSIAGDYCLDKTAAGSGAIVTGQPGIGKKPIHLEFFFDD
jgi:hypothetical protein